MSKYKPTYQAATWEFDLCFVEIRLHPTERHCTSHYKAYHGQISWNSEGATHKDLATLVSRALGRDAPEDDRLDFMEALEAAVTAFTGKVTANASGTYIGDEEQFQGRSADLVVSNDIVMAQFDEGEIWETHSRLNFPTTDWDYVSLDAEVDA